MYAQNIILPDECAQLRFDSVQKFLRLLASEKNLDEFLPDEFDDSFMEQKEYINYVKALPSSTDLENEISKLEKRIEINRREISVRENKVKKKMYKTIMETLPDPDYVPITESQDVL